MIPAFYFIGSLKTVHTELIRVFPLFFKQNSTQVGVCVQPKLDDEQRADRRFRSRIFCAPAEVLTTLLAAAIPGTAEVGTFGIF